MQPQEYTLTQPHEYTKTTWRDVNKEYLPYPIYISVSQNVQTGKLMLETSFSG